MASAFSRETVTPFAGAGKVDLLDPAALAIYAWQALDETLFKTAIRIQAGAVQRAVKSAHHDPVHPCQVRLGGTQRHFLCRCSRRVVKLYRGCVLAVPRVARANARMPAPAEA